MTTRYGDSPSRRDFLRTTACAAAAGVGGAVTQAIGAPASQPNGQKPLLPHGTLGRTRYPVTLVSFGAIKLRDRNHTRVLKLAIDKGVNLLHTSDSYGGGKSIAAVAELFRAEKSYRDKVFLCLKGLSRQKEAELDKMLATLHTDHVDAWLCEFQKPDEKRLEMLQTMLDSVKKKGKVKHAGFVCHVDMNGSIEMVVEKAPNFFDVALIAMTMAPIPGDKSKDRVGEQSERFVRNIKALRQCGVGILSMKSGAAEAVQKGTDVYQPHARALLQAGADSLLTSMDAFEQVEMIAKLDIKSPHMTADDRKAEAEFRRSRANACLMCGTCTGVCPLGLPVNDLMRFRMYSTQYGLHDQARLEYAALGAEVHRTAMNCGDCDTCTMACPVGLASARTVAETAAMLG